MLARICSVLRSGIVSCTTCKAPQYTTSLPHTRATKLADMCLHVLINTLTLNLMQIFGTRKQGDYAACI
jgi:hypothetical protein